MTVLVCCLGSDQVTWPIVLRLAAMEEWEKVSLVGPSSVKGHLQLKGNMSFVAVDERNPVVDEIRKLSAVLGNNAFGEVAVNLFSGSGLLHMIVISAVLRAGCGVKLVHFADKLIEL